MKGAPQGRLLGLSLFALYCTLYAAFVLTAAFGTFEAGAPKGGLANEAFAGLSWGVVGGFGLIVGAFVLAVLYAIFARGGDAAGSGGDGGRA